jgi:hypothetical protein
LLENGLWQFPALLVDETPREGETSEEGRTMPSPGASTAAAERSWLARPGAAARVRLAVGVALAATAGLAVSMMLHPYKRKPTADVVSPERSATPAEPALAAVEPSPVAAAVHPPLAPGADAVPPAECVARIGSRPWAAVFLDGAPVGFTPLAELRLTCGPHDLVLKNAERGLEAREHFIAEKDSPFMRVFALEGAEEPRP